MTGVSIRTDPRGLAPGSPQSSGADAITPSGDLAIGAGEVGTRSGGPPCPAQRLPANQLAPEREERAIRRGQYKRNTSHRNYEMRYLT